MKRLLSLCLSFAAAVSLHAQTPYLVRDINTISPQTIESSNPAFFFPFQSRVFFMVLGEYSAAQLWSTDGTEGGTAQLKGTFTPAQDPRFVELNGKLLFNASDGRGEELWTTDGTSAGTRLLADISSGYPSSRPGDRIVYGNSLLFAADDGLDGSELWLTDGTPAGTHFVKDIVPGSSGSGPHSFVRWQGLVYFSAGGGLWKTDGTDGGTVRVKDGVSAQNLTVAGSRLFFNGYTSAAGQKAWISDGTEGGTRIITSDATPGYTSTFTALGNRVLFDATDAQHGAEIWISDGTGAGTHLVRDLNPGTASSITVTPGITAVGSLAFFSASTSATGRALWKTDGTEEGTTIVAGTEQSGAWGIGVAGSNVFFTVAAGSGATLAATDLTGNGFHMVRTGGAPLYVLRISSYAPSVLTNIGGTLYFAAATGRSGAEPWKSDGTDGGTVMIANLAAEGVPSSLPNNFIAAGDWIYFEAADGLATVGPTDPTLKRSLWRSDGTEEGTLSLQVAPGNQYVTANHSLFFTAQNMTWTSDGTPQGSGPARAFRDRFPNIPTIAFTRGDTLFVTVYKDYSGGELWMTKNAPGAPAVSLGGPGSGIYFADFADMAGRFLYSSAGLWTTDGTPSGTFAVRPDFGDAAIVSRPVVMRGLAYFSTYNYNTNKGNLWRSDGTFEGTVAFSDISGVGGLVAAGKNLFFTVNGELGVTDGTAAGTHMLAVKPYVSWQGTNVLAPAGDRVVFAVADSPNGMELWISDGTADGTHMLRDILPGTNGSYPGNLTAAAGLVWFTANDGVHGTELWSTDGTADGTKLVADLEPGIASSGPAGFVLAGNRLFFSATTQDTGAELWALPLSGTPRLSVDDVRIAEGDTGTSAARFTVTLSSPATQTVTAAYATSDGSALAGSDYDAAAGIVTFAAGETSKTIDVRVHGNTTAENNRTFFVTLSNPSGAALGKPSAFAIIDDDDQTADLALKLDFSNYDSYTVTVNATNNGPRAITNLTLVATAAPSDAAASTCTICSGTPVQLVAGATSRVFEYRWFGFQQYLTATLTAHQRDPLPSNNTVAWMTNTNLAMDAHYLTPGSDANVWVTVFQRPATVSVESSNPTVLSVPATVPIPATGKAITSFPVHGVSAGSATIRVYSGAVTIGTLAVNVLAPGTKQRLPDGLRIFTDNSPVPFDRPIIVRIYPTATAPYTGERPTGLVTVTANGHEVGRTILTGELVRQIAVQLPSVGVQPLRIDYAGDANFLPMSRTSNVEVSTGYTTILAQSIERSGTTAKLHLILTGSPFANPTGTITVSETGVIPAFQVPLTAGAGFAQAEVALQNLSSGYHTLTILYSGDGHYFANSQQVRIPEVRKHVARH